MFRVIDSQILLRLRLEHGRADSPCRVVRWSDGGEFGRPRLTILHEQSGRTSLFVPGGADSGDVLVVLDGEETGRLGESRMPLQDYPRRICTRLLDDWPSASQQSEIIAALVAPGAATECESTWLVDARRWLRISPLLGSAPLGQSAEEFFDELRREVDRDRRAWSTLPPPPPTPTTRRIRLAPRATPASFLVEMRKAYAAARLAAAASSDGRAGFLPYLEAALATHWSGICQEGNLLRELFAGVLPEEIAIGASITHGDRADSTGKAIVRFGDRNDGCIEFTVGVPFVARSEITEDWGPCHARLAVSVPPPNWRVRPPAKPMLKRLESYLNDLSWSLERFFAKHALTVRGSERLFFKDVNHLRSWTQGTEEDREARLHLLAKSWQTAGSPLVGRLPLEHFLSELAESLLE